MRSNKIGVNSSAELEHDHDTSDGVEKRGVGIQMVQLKFRFDQRLLIELGRQLVSKDEVAVSELVKNSYDADASIVEIRINDDRISIADNGTGINWGTIERGWLVVGTTWKKRHSRSPIRHRRVLGEKGIGRLSAFRLTVSLMSYYSGILKIISDKGWSREVF